MKSVDYTSYDFLECAECAGAIIICLDSSLTVDGSSYIEGIAASVECDVDCNGKTIYNYAFTYEESQLANPSNDLLSTGIDGVICKGCLTTYIESYINKLLPPAT